MVLTNEDDENRKLLKEYVKEITILSQEAPGPHQALRAMKKDLLETKILQKMRSTGLDFKNIRHEQEIANQYGLRTQLGQLMEECAEVIQSANKLCRVMEEKTDSFAAEMTAWEMGTNHLIEELADVKVVAVQLGILIGFNSSDINKFAECKIDRQYRRILGKDPKPEWQGDVIDAARYSWIRKAGEEGTDRNAGV